MILESLDPPDLRVSRVSLVRLAGLVSEVQREMPDKLDKTVPEDLRDPRETWDPRDPKERLVFQELPGVRERGDCQVVMGKKELMVSRVSAGRDFPEHPVVRVELDRLDPRERREGTDRMDERDLLETLDFLELKDLLECLELVEERA